MGDNNASISLDNFGNVAIVSNDIAASWLLENS